MLAQEHTITAHTGLVGVFGHPVRHSLSPCMHNAAFASQGVDMIYLAFDVLPDRLGRALEGLRALGMRGANLTVPHKEAAIKLLDEVDSLAARVGAVNTVLQKDGRLLGYNTDVAGFTAALGLLLPGGARGLRCLVVGAGGAARAVVAALVDAGAAMVWVHNRTHEKAVALCETASKWGETLCEAIPADRLREAAMGANVIINATSLGLAGSVKDFAIPVDTLSNGHCVMDLVYASRPTALVEAARGRGAVAADGKEMLIMQAACSYQLWTGLEPPIEAMRSSIAREEG